MAADTHRSCEKESVLNKLEGERDGKYRECNQKQEEKGMNQNSKKRGGRESSDGHRSTKNEGTKEWKENGYLKALQLRQFHFFPVSYALKLNISSPSGYVGALDSSILKPKCSCSHGYNGRFANKTTLN